MAYSFNGTSQLWSTTSTPISAAPLTMACWFNPANTTGAFNLMHTGIISGTSRFVLQARGDAGGDPVRCSAVNSAGTLGTADTSTSFSANLWQHACAVFTSTTSRDVYLNGGGAGNNTTAITPSTPTSIRLAGQVVSGTPTQWLNGLMAEAAIWNVALNTDEVTALAKGFAPSRIRPASLVFYAPMLRDIVDLKGGLAITNTNTATVADHPRIF